jgi:putative ABC transport system permease protein
MRLAESARVAGTAIAANRLRAGLTTLGVVIGVLSVVLLVAVGTGARDEVTGSVERLGSNLLLVFPGEFDGGQPPARSEFTLDDVERLRRDLPPGALVTTSLSGGETVRADGEEASAAILGVTQEYPQITGRTVVRGQFFAESDVAVGRRSAVLDQQAAERLFGGRDPLTRDVSIGGLRFRVVGVLEDFQGAAFGPQPGAQILVPVTAAQRLFNLPTVDSLIVQAPDRELLPVVQAEVERILTTAPGARDRRVSIITQDEILGVAGQILDTLTLVLAAIAGISLLVGGIGVSNIMLVSVSERTREVGLRKALGARTRDITAQFLVEAVVLCGLGGLLGIGLGIGLAEAAEAFTPLPATVTLWSVLTAFGVSLAVGVVFGVYPAWRAGRLDPVVALRHE